MLESPQVSLVFGLTSQNRVALMINERKYGIKIIRYLAKIFHGMMNMVRKGQISGIKKGDILGQVEFVSQIFEVAA